MHACVSVHLQVNGACLRYQSSMAQLSDQVKMLYRDYANQVASWRMERSSTDKQVISNLCCILYMMLWMGSTQQQVNCFRASVMLSVVAACRCTDRNPLHADL
jgi:hypothetical protein